MADHDHDDPAPAGGAEAERLFAAYCKLAERAQRSLDLHDGLAAGRAWRRFLDSFLPRPELRSSEPRLVA